MTTAINILGNIFGVSTFFMIFLGFLRVITSGNLGIQEITFLMFAFFIMTTLISMTRTKGKKDENGVNRA